MADDEIRRIENRLDKLSNDCEKNVESLNALRFEIHTKFNIHDVRITELNSMFIAIKEQINNSITRIESSVSQLHQNQSDTSKEVTTVVTKLTIVFGVIMILISAGLSKFLE